METITSISALKAIIKETRQEGKTVGLVPTMGYFHEGHLSLMRQARQENDLVVVSLFVNPIQFGPKEDLQSYPRDLERDQKLAATVGVDILFLPSDAAVYPEGYQTYVEVKEVSQGLCGSSRPEHFKGVATIVLKLFNLVTPDRAYFGAKDAQQLRVIKRMSLDLNLNLEIVACPIVREPDGLAMSSRNVYLDPAQREAALVLSRVLRAAEKLVEAGERSVQTLNSKLLELLAVEPLANLDYLAFVASDSLQPVTTVSGEVLIAIAVKIGKTRLIDNTVVKG